MQQKPGSSLEPNLDGQDGPGVGVADQVKNAFPSQRRERGEALDRPYDFSESCWSEQGGKGRGDELANVRPSFVADV
jgi:hypothetical protein